MRGKTPALFGETIEVSDARNRHKGIWLERSQWWERSEDGIDTKCTLRWRMIGTTAHMVTHVMYLWLLLMPSSLRLPAGLSTSSLRQGKAIVCGNVDSTQRPSSCIICSSFPSRATVMFPSSTISPGMRRDGVLKKAMSEKSLEKWWQERPAKARTGDMRGSAP